VERESLVDNVDRGDQLCERRRESTGGDHLWPALHLLTEAPHQTFDEADVAEDDARLHAGRGRVADRFSGSDELDPDEHRGMADQRVVAELDTGRDRSSQIVPLRIDCIEGRGRAEVHQDAGTAVEVMGGNRVGDPVGPDPARVVVLDADAGPGAGPDDHRRRIEVGVGKFVDAPRKRGNHAADHDGGDLRGRQVAPPEQVDEDEPQFVTGEPIVRMDPEVGDQRVAVKDPDDDIGIPDVDREQHGGECRHHRDVIALLDIGGTKIAAAAGRGTAIGMVRRIATPVDSPLATLRSLVEGVMGGVLPEAIAISAPGPFDRGSGALLNPPGMPASWHGLEMAHLLGQRFDCPVVVENDANCAAIAEARLGAGAGQRTVVYWTVSTGIGCGVVRDGRIVVGRHDTEGGHIVLWPAWLGGPPCHCGGAGCLEALASGRSIARRYGVAAEHLSDPEAWAEIGRWLGLAIVNVTALHDPDVVIFGGGVCTSWSRFAPALFETVERSLHLQPPPEITRGTLGEERSLLGALLIAEDSGEDPSRLLTAR
jgi:glucokinase